MIPIQCRDIGTQRYLTKALRTFQTWRRSQMFLHVFREGVCSSTVEQWPLKPLIRVRFPADLPEFERTLEKLEHIGIEKLDANLYIRYNNR